LEIKRESATIPLNVEQLAASILHNPIQISIDVKNSIVESISQKLHICRNDAGKLLAIRN
jgi:superfamily II DNA/RNA helicase